MTATGATLARLRRRLSRTLLFMVVLCLAITVILSAFERGGWGPHLIYSFCIGTCCWLLTDGSRLLTAWATDQFRRLRRWPPSASGFDGGWRGIIPAVLVAMVLGPPIGMALADAITGFQSPSLFLLDASNTRVTLAFTLVASLTSVFVLSLVERLSSARTQAETAQRQAAENQLRLLQSQLEPHMLFNTLANLRVLIGIDRDRAQAMLDHLIAFLRATLDASRQATHSLGAEFEHLRDYLALMAVRMGPRLSVAFDLPAELSAFPVPPLLLQPLVENAIKHGLEPKVEGGRIAVSAARVGATLRLTVRDSGVGLAATAGTGGSAFGLEQVRTRLATLYGESATLSLLPADADGGAVALITLPLNRLHAATP